MKQDASRGPDGSGAAFVSVKRNVICGLILFSLFAALFDRLRVSSHLLASAGVPFFHDPEVFMFYCHVPFPFRPHNSCPFNQKTNRRSGWPSATAAVCGWPAALSPSKICSQNLSRLQQLLHLRETFETSSVSPHHTHST